ERLPVANVVHGPRDRRFSLCYRADRDLHAFPGQLLHQVDETVVLLSQQVFGGHLDVVEAKLGGVLALQTHLLQALALGKTLHRRIDDNETRTFRTLRRIRLRDHDHKVAVPAVRYEGLRAVDDVAIALAYRARL